MSNLANAGKKERFGVVMLFIVSLILSLGSEKSCSPGVGDTFSPKELLRLFKEAGGWIPLPIPDSKYRPGAIIKVTEEGIRWIDDLSACGYPLAEFEEKGYTPSITFTKAIELGASAIINVKGISAGPGFNRVSKVRLEITEQGADGFRLMELIVWMENPDNQKLVSRACMDALLQPDTYLVNEAFRIKKGKYTLYDKSGAEIKIETPLLKELLQIQPDIKYEVTSEGSLAIEQPAYFAVRKVQRIGQNFKLLSRPGGESDTADSKIEKIFLQTAENR